MSENNQTPTLTKKDFTSDQDVRWCPGCGDYAILSQVQKIFPTFGIPKEDFLIVSGIGCASRFPYYMDTYGFHSIHGRATAVASGAKEARATQEEEDGKDGFRLTHTIDGGTPDGATEIK